MAWTKAMTGQQSKLIIRHRVQQNMHRQAMMQRLGRSQAILSQRGKKRRSQRGKKHPNQPNTHRQIKHGRRRTQSQHGKRLKSMIMNLTKRRLLVIIIIHTISAREESSKRNWRNESKLTCKNWLHSMHWNWKLFLMNNKIWMAKV